AVSGKSEVLSKSKATTVKHLMEASGPDFSNIQALGSLLRIWSATLVQKKKLLTKERHLLQLHHKGMNPPDLKDPFPDLILDPGFT
ncbi:hypothetical protein XENOCAPTIV_012365, partial [Xenoophorus captivus]